MRFISTKDMVGGIQMLKSQQIQMKLRFGESGFHNGWNLAYLGMLWEETKSGGGLLLNFGSRSLQFKRGMKPNKNRQPKSSQS